MVVTEAFGIKGSKAWRFGENLCKLFSVLQKYLL